LHYLVKMKSGLPYYHCEALFSKPNDFNSKKTLPSKLESLK
jgi:hypothetical protein